MIPAILFVHAIFNFALFNYALFLYCFMTLCLFFIGDHFQRIQVAEFRGSRVSTQPPINQAMTRLYFSHNVDYVYD